MIGENVDVWRIPLSRTAAELTTLRALLDPTEESRASMFRAERDRNRYIVSHATLRMVLAGYAGVEPRNVRFIVRPGGKPVFAGDGTLHFNLSHCDELAICGIADREIGVDVERLKHHPDMERVARHFFSADEVRRLETLPGSDSTQFFFRTWVRKEAYIKATGEGLTRDTTSFTVQKPEAGVILHAVDGTHRPDNSYSVYDVPDIEGCFAAVAVAAAGTAPAIRYREWPA